MGASGRTVGLALLSVTVVVMLAAGGIAVFGGSRLDALGLGPSGDATLSDSHLMILGSPREEYVRGVALAFQEETGIQTTYVRMSSGDALEEIRRSHGSPPYSVWWGGPIDQYIDAASEGLLVPYEPRVYNLIPGKYKDSSRYWTGIYVGVLAFGVNTRVLSERGLPTPASWADLIKPIYRGQVTMAHPATSGTAYTTISTIAQLQERDIQNGFAYLRLLNANVRAYERAGDTPVRVAARGDAAIAIAFSHDIVAAIEEGYQDLKVVFPEDGTGYEIGGVAVIRNGPDPEAARRFVDFATSRRAQELGPRFAAYQIPTNPDARVPDKSVTLSTVNTIDYDFAWAATHRDELVTRFATSIAPIPK